MTKPVEILLAEDDPGDTRLTAEALKTARLSSNLHVVHEGAEALAFLRREGAHANAPAIDLVLLDLNLPGKDGRAVLTEMKEDPALRRIPVIVLSGSNAEKDVIETYDHHANCYIPKPTNLDQFVAVIRSIEDFWLNVVQLLRE